MPYRYKLIHMKDGQYMVWDYKASCCEGIYTSKRNALRRLVSLKYPDGKNPTIPGNPAKREVKPASSAGSVNAGDTTKQVAITDDTPGRASRYGQRRVPQDDFYRLSPEMVRDVKAKNAKPKEWRRQGRVQGISR